MFDKKYLKDIGQQTLSVISSGKYSINNKHFDISKDINDSFDRTKLYSQYVDINHFAPINSFCQIKVFNEKTSCLAKRIIEKTNEKVIVLNFASGTNPGGGWLNGANAQEEDLARCSSLVHSLNKYKVFYETNKTTNHLYTNSIIYSPDVIFFRDDMSYEFVDSYKISVITSPAPNVSVIGSNEDVKKAIVERTKRILQIASINGYRNIVLGAWGCGVFGNDPNFIAKSFIESFLLVGNFQRLYFAVFDKRKNEPLFKCFKQIIKL